MALKQTLAARPVERDGLRWLDTLLLATLLMTLAVHVAGACFDAVAAIGSPLELDYGEGIVWQQAALIPGPRMYPTSEALPFIVFHYPPMFHLLARAALWVMPDFLAAGRLVAAMSTFALAPLVAGLVLVVTWRPGRIEARAVAIAVAAGMLVLGLHAVRSWGFLMRVDMVGIAFCLAGLLIAAYADGRFWGTTAALLLCVAAVFTKQTLLPAGVAVFAIAVLRRPLPALAAAAVAGGTGLAALLWLQSTTSGGFLHNIVGYNINRFSFLQGRRVLMNEWMTAPVAVLMIVAAIWLARSILRVRPGFTLRNADQQSSRRALLLLYFALVSVMLITVCKTGSSRNYLLEWLSAGCGVLGVMLADLASGSRIARRCSAVIMLGLVLAMELQPVRMIPSSLGPNVLAANNAVIQMIATANKPVVAENMVMLMRAGAGVHYEPAIVTELALTDRWDEAPLLRAIRAHDYAFFLTTDGRDGNPERRTPAVDAAIREAYPRSEQLGPDLWIRRPE